MRSGAEPIASCSDAAEDSDRIVTLPGALGEREVPKVYDRLSSLVQPVAEYCPMSTRLA
jgi:hypothetical protein